jgi:hypothetical protein
VLKKFLLLLTLVAGLLVMPAVSASASVIPPTRETHCFSTIHNLSTGSGTQWVGGRWMFYTSSLTPAAGVDCLDVSVNQVLYSGSTTTGYMCVQSVSDPGCDGDVFTVPYSTAWWLAGVINTHETFKIYSTAHVLAGNSSY